MANISMLLNFIINSIVYFLLSLNNINFGGVTYLELMLSLLALSMAFTFLRQFLKKESVSFNPFQTKYYDEYGNKITKKQFDSDMKLLVYDNVPKYKYRKNNKNYKRYR